MTGVDPKRRHYSVLLPQPIIALFHNHSQVLFASTHDTPTTEEAVASAIHAAKDFGGLAALYGYVHEEHVILTKDGYILTLHHIPQRKGMCGSACLHEFVLTVLALSVQSVGFDFAWHDIPNSIEYILEHTSVGSLGYVGFSQGTTQALPVLSINLQLNETVNVLVALAPAMSPTGLATPIVDALMKASPTSIYLFFGRKAILSSVTTWQAIFYPHIFTSIIDHSLGFFSWDNRNITTTQKTAVYTHLYSYVSVKSVVHWFQIMRESTFQMFDDDITVFGGSANASKAYRPPQFPTRNIKTPILLLYGNRDSLVDINTMVSALPVSGTRVKKLDGYEHLDILWGKDIDKDVFPEVVNALQVHCKTSYNHHVHPRLSDNSRVTSSNVFWKPAKEWLAYSNMMEVHILVPIYLPH
ncbi:Alpha/Beta hydrolase fold [Tylopilus felleus]